ncbi:MAG: YjgN family protein [Sideroxydans sp.]|nr:YjgN family protein [Sideroxydans sp.]
MQARQEHSFEFTGKGWEYFRIWIVNLLLSILTLGIYSAWAKVRRLQYFYRNTHLAGSSFEYHGTPIAILKGRIIAFVLMAAYTIAGQMNPLLAILIFVLLAAVMPWLIVRSLRFKLYNSSYRGLRFGFAGSDGAAYAVFLLFPILTVLTLYLLAPFTHFKIKQYQHNNSRFGDTFFRFDATAGNFYGIYLKALGLLVLAGVLFGITAAMHMPWLGLLLPLLYLYIVGFMAVRLPNLIWDKTGLGEHDLYSRMEVGKYLWIAFTNLLGIVFTLGLFIPFAQIRMARYKFSCMGLLAQGDLSEFVAGQVQADSATGEETAEMFDLDISL